MPTGVRGDAEEAGDNIEDVGKDVSRGEQKGGIEGGR